MDALYFHDNARRAADLLLDSPFGARLRQLVEVEANEPHDYLAVHLTETADNYLSRGELVMLDVLTSLAGRGDTVDLGAVVDRLDDQHWDRVIAALFLARGRVLAPVTLAESAAPR